VAPAFVIRDATMADAPGLLDCLRDAFAPFRDAYTPEAFADTVLTPETLPARLQSMTVLVATSDDGSIAGTVAFSPLCGQC